MGVLDKQTAAQAGYKLNVDAGVIVMQLELGSPADQAGIRQRDLILKIDGKDTNTVADLRSIIKSAIISQSQSQEMDKLAMLQLL